MKRASPLETFAPVSKSTSTITPQRYNRRGYVADLEGRRLRLNGYHPSVRPAPIRQNSAIEGAFLELHRSVDNDVVLRGVNSKQGPSPPAAAGQHRCDDDDCRAGCSLTSDALDNNNSVTSVVSRPIL